MPTSVRLRGILAGLLLAAATIGLPLALAATIGDPLHAWSSLSAGQLSDTDVTAVLAAVFWLAWISFTLPALVEIVTAVAARLRRQPPRSVRIPLLGAQQDLARHLISAALLVLPVASTAVASPSVPSTHYPAAEAIATAAAWTAPTRHPAVTADGSQHPAAATADAPHRGTARTYLIPATGGMRSYWALAEHYLDDGARWREIWQLNEGRVHTDGTVMDTPRQLHAGWTILLPPAARRGAADPPPAACRTVTVQPGDTLAGIAAAHHVGDWRQLWTTNADRDEPDHARLTDPDLIRPGWTISLPDRDPGRPVHAPDATAGANHRPAPTRPDHDSHIGRPERPADEHANPPTSGDSPPATEPPSPAATHPASGPSGTAASAATHHQPDRRHRDPLPAVPLEVGLAAAAAVAALDRARRIAQRRRRVGHRPLPPPARLRQVEAELRHAARASHPAVAAVELATALTATTPVSIPTVIARDDGAVDLYLTAALTPPPPPFIAIPAGWRLPAADAGFTFALDDVDEPTPTLTPVGRLPDGEVLLNLAERGPISIAGDSDIVTRYLTQLVAALVAAPWAGRLQIHVSAAFAGQVGDYEPVTVDLGPPRLPAVLPGVPSGAEEPGWCTAPIYLYLGWTATDPIEDLLRAATDPTIAIHTIVNGATEDTAVWALDGDRLAVPGVDEPITVTVPGAAAPTPAALVAHTATAPDVAVGDPRLPDLAADAPPDRRASSNQLNLLGPVELDGVEPPRRSQILNLLTYLALHRRGADHDTLDTILWTRRVSGKTLRNRLVEARALVGGEISDGPIWRLSDAVTTDWQQFAALATGSPAEQHAALRLVRGRPFEGLDYADWIDLEGIRSEVEATIVDVALTVAERDLATGEPDAALAAARAGLAASRYEERLHRLAIRAAQAAGHTTVVDTLKAEMRAAIDDDIEPDDTLQADTLRLYEELRRPRAAANDR